MSLFQLFGGLRESAVDVSFFVGAAKGVPVYVRGKGLQLLEEAVVVGQYKDVADGCFFFDEAYVMFRWKQVGFGDLVSSAYLASCVLRRKLQAGGKLETFLCGGVVEFPGDFRQLLEGVEAVSYTHLDVYKRQRQACAESSLYSGSVNIQCMPLAKSSEDLYCAT